ncbi:MAG: hypothetical protein BAA04_00305 [Firmicutes bacterium ZCTH02-B6]|nr:MAG: hypothetical protein BAA04_00305 [Firmicutes bacterium ZCTH02-B6]
MAQHDHPAASEQPEAVDFRPIADKIVTTCLRVRPGEVIQIGGGVHNFAFVGALAAAVRRAGAFAELNVTSDDLQLETLTTVPLEYLQQVPQHRLRWLEHVDALIVTDSVADPRLAMSVPEERRRAAEAAAEAVQRHIFERGVRVLYVPYPTPAARAGMPITFANLWSMFWRAVDVDYEVMQQEAAALAAALEGAQEVRLLADNGTDLTLTIGDRPVLADDGVMSDDDVAQGDTAVNLPAGEVFVAPVEASVHGRAVIDFAFRNGQTMRGLELTVEQGRVTLVGTPQGGCAFREILAMGHGDADVIGELGIGLNPGVERLCGYGPTDEKRRGTVHLGLGENRYFGGANAADFHWDLFVERPTLIVDGRTLIEAGALRL